MARGTAPPLDPEALRDARLAAGLSQAALARAAGTDRRQVIRYENGAERPEIGRLAALARACSVTVADLVDEEHLPPGLAGLRVSAGLTMAAAAAALGEHIDPATGIATNRASLSYAERGRMPLSWQPALNGLKVRLSMADVYDTDADTVREAWNGTFPDDPHRPGVSREGSDQSASGSLNATSNEAAPQPPPPPLAETAALVWGTDRPASQEWRIRARIREADGSEVEAVATGIEGSPPVVGWWTSHRGLSRTVYGEVVQALEWTSPWRSMPEAAPLLPGARPARPGDAVELPFDGDGQEHEQAPDGAPQEDVRLERVAAEQAEVFEVGAARMWRVLHSGRLAGFVWRDADYQQWCGARAAADGGLGEIAILSPRFHHTRQSVVEHLLDPTAAYICGITPAAVDTPAPAAPEAVSWSRWSPLSQSLWEHLLRIAAAGPTGAVAGGEEAHWQERLGEESGRGFLAATGQRCWLTEAGREHILAHREEYAHMYPEVGQPRSVRQLSAQSVLREEPAKGSTAKEVDMSAKIGPGWTLRRQGPAEGHTWILMHQGQERGTVRRYRPRNRELSLHREEVLSRGWEALAGDSQRRMRRSATDEGKFGRRSSFLWRSRDLAAWGIATNPKFAQPNPSWARRPRKKRQGDSWPASPI
ncbi:helix-turn-helix transcriptional regulator [Nocardiopsis ganjiahuensis]|uniref:helix-turn-helix transcriptional regulator n=1 Tax=Nocardiopsis ganjiahuensis TaxID=239984 RepID=UPI000344B695|nr:helix-turn-helix transcriptional regulator [Nocardiopsis ganjiahuensis]